MAKTKTYCVTHDYREAIGSYELTRYDGRTQQFRTDSFPACNECLAASAKEAARQTPFTKDWHTAQVDRLASTMRQAIADWFENGRDDSNEVHRLYGVMLCSSRALTAELSAIGALNYQEAVRA